MIKFDVTTQKRPYVIQDPESIVTPALLVFADRIERNIQRMRGYLEASVAGAGFANLCPHVKTNKSVLITRQMLQAGITSVKCTMREIQVALDAGAKDIFVAYPLLRHEARELARIRRKHPDIGIHVQIGALAHAEILKRVAESKKISWSYFIDLDVGMERTGTKSAGALDLYRQVSAWKEFEFAGLHGYDGHIHHESLDRRRKEAALAMGKLIDVAVAFRAAGIRVPRVIAAGSPTFELDLKILTEQLPAETQVQVSPGTWIFWDSSYNSILFGKFEMAAMLLAQVIDVDGKVTATLNLGHKRWGADQGRLELFSDYPMSCITCSEEHLVVVQSPLHCLKIGDYVLAAPRHVCPTVNLYEHFTLIDRDDNGKTYAVEGRNR